MQLMLHSKSTGRLCG